MEQDQGNALVRLVTTFEGIEIDVIWLRGRPHWIARQVGHALGYADRGRVFVRMITGEWSDELAEDLDRTLLTGDELAALKALRPDLIDARTPSLLLLTESGVFAAVLLSRQPRARAFRQWMSREVLPTIGKTGGYQLPGASVPDQRRAWLSDLRARGDLSVHAYAAEMMRMEGRQLGATGIAWSPSLPPLVLPYSAWPEIEASLTRPWSTTAIGAALRFLQFEASTRPTRPEDDLHQRWQTWGVSYAKAREVMDDKGSWSDPAFLWTFQQVSVEEALEALHNPNRPPPRPPQRTTAGLLGPQDWPAVAKLLTKPWPEVAARYDARVRLEVHDPISVDRLAAVWGWTPAATAELLRASADVASLRPWLDGGAL